MKKIRLLLLDANVVIELFEAGVWDKVVAACDVHLTRTVVDCEATFYVDKDGNHCPLELQPYEEDGRITVHDVSSSDVEVFKEHLDPSFLERLDPGEAEALTLLVSSLDTDQQFMICSADHIVFRVLGALFHGDRGISLEEVLECIGLRRKLKAHFCKSFRVKWTEQGAIEGISGFGGCR